MNDLKKRKKEIKRKLKAEETLKNMEILGLSEGQLSSLIYFLDENLEKCDHTFKIASVWASKNNVDIDDLSERFTKLSAYCDCEIIFNIALSSWCPIDFKFED